MEWRLIEATGGNYSVSNSGLIRRNKGLDSVGRRIKETILATAYTKKNRGYVNLCVDGVMKTVSVSRIVAEYFIKGGGSDYQVRHIDLNPRNNEASNLFYIHSSEDRGEYNGFSRLSEDDVLTIRRMGSEGISSSFIAESHNIKQGTVRRIITGKAWPHIKTSEDNSKNGNRWNDKKRSSES